MSYVLFDIFCSKKMHRKFSIPHFSFTLDSYLLLLCGIVIATLTTLDQAHAQATTLRPPVTLQSGGNLQNNTAQQQAQTMSTARFQTLKVNGKLVDLRTLSNNDVLTGKNGKSISVARIKQLQARLDAAKGRPAITAITARQGQSLRSLASEPAGTRIVLANSRTVKSQDLAKVQNVFAKLSVKRVIRPLPQAMNNAQAQATVGPNLSITDALKRPGSDVIQIGSRKYSVEQLRLIDSQLKASKYEPRGLVERAGSRKRTGAAGSTRSTPNPRGVQ
jgi:hypothetical protein